MEAYIYMARDIRNFSKEYKDSPKKNFKDMRREDLDEQGKSQYDEIKSKAKQLEGKSENQLMDELFKRVNEGKKNGTLSNSDLDYFAAQAAPMLNAEQRKKLQSLLAKMKN